LLAGVVAKVGIDKNFGEQFRELWIKSGEMVLRFGKVSTGEFQTYIYIVRV
jgi:hypothetical protein